MLLRAAATSEVCMITEKLNTEFADSNHFTCISAIFSILAALFGPSNRFKLIPVAACSKAWMCYRSFARIAVTNSEGGRVCLSLENVVCWQVEVSATGQQLVRRSPTERVMSQYDLILRTVRRPTLTSVVEP